MGKRRFVIKECPVTGDPYNFSIGEAELKRRIIYMQECNDNLDEAMLVLCGGQYAERRAHTTGGHDADR